MERRLMRSARLLLIAVFVFVASAASVPTATDSGFFPAGIWSEAFAAAPVYGIYKAIVLDNIDPLFELRLQIEVPALSLSGLWALPCVPVGTSNVPQIGSGVWIMFEQGNIRHPVWMGTWEPLR